MNIEHICIKLKDGCIKLTIGTATAMLTVNCVKLDLRSTEHLTYKLSNMAELNKLPSNGL